MGHIITGTVFYSLQQFYCCIPQNKPFCFYRQHKINIEVCIGEKITKCSQAPEYSAGSAEGGVIEFRVYKLPGHHVYVVMKIRVLRVKIPLFHFFYSFRKKSVFHTIFHIKILKVTLI